VNAESFQDTFSLALYSRYIHISLSSSHACHDMILLPSSADILFTEFSLHRQRGRSHLFSTGRASFICDRHKRNRTEVETEAARVLLFSSIERQTWHFTAIAADRVCFILYGEHLCFTSSLHESQNRELQRAFQTLTISQRLYQREISGDL